VKRTELLIDGDLDTDEMESELELEMPGVGEIDNDCDWVELCDKDSEGLAVGGDGEKLGVFDCVDKV
jgi:hypothetical protein